MQGFAQACRERILFRQHPHRIFQSPEGKRVHALLHQLLNDADALAVLPDAVGLGVDPGKFGECAGQAL